MEPLFRIATHVSTPLALGGLFAAILFYILRQIIAKNIFPRLSASLGAGLLRIIVDRLFVLALVAMILGFAGYALTIIRPIKANITAGPGADQYAEVMRLRIDDLQTKTANLKDILAEIKAGKITSSGPVNKVNDLNNGLSDLWLKIAGYGLGRDPDLENIFFSASAFNRATLAPSYGMNDVPQTMGIPRLYQRFLESTESSQSVRRSKEENLREIVEVYSNPERFPFKDFYDRAYTNYRNGQDIQTVQFNDDVNGLEVWLDSLSSNLTKVKQLVVY